MSSLLEQAVEEYARGKAEAFTTLYEESNKYIYTCVYKVMAGNDNAQDMIADIMQDTYVEISKSITQLDNRKRFLQWAGMIATRKCYAYLKKNKKYVLLNEEDDTFENLSDSESIIPEEVMQDREKQRLVREIIDTQLTEIQKLCVIGYYYNEQKQSEIAQELGIPENTVKTNLSRAKAKIRDGVVDLEKNKGTKLYSVAPLLLLLFKEDVQAAVVSRQITESVLSSVSGSAVSAASAGAKGLLGKLGGVSMKAKAISAIAAVGAAGIIGGTVFATIHNNEQDEQQKQEVSAEQTVWKTEQKVQQEVQQAEVIPAQEETVPEQEEIVPEQEIQLSEAEYAGIKMMVETFTESSLTDQDTYTVDFKDMDNFVWFIQVLASRGADSAYLPVMEMIEGEFGAEEKVSIQDMETYLNHVFVVENMDMRESGYVSGDNITFPIEAYDTTISTAVEKVNLEADGSYRITGSVKCEYFEHPEYDDAYKFTMLAVKNADSPFGFKVSELFYERMELGEFKMDSGKKEGSETLADILLYPAEHSDYYPADADKANIWFAVADLDHDGANEVLLADKYSPAEEEAIRIINILTEKDEVVADYDGNHTYRADGQFTLYDTNILHSLLMDGWGKTSFWNLSTGENLEGMRWKPTEETKWAPAGEREEYAYLKDQNGKVYEGTEGDAMYESLTQGNEVPLTWYQATPENVSAVLR